MRIAWYRKYRPQTFSQVVGQEHIKTTLLNQINLGKVAHAYLFAGPKGTGKTSLARILARAVNCMEPNVGEPCGKCQNCDSQASGQMIDLIEIDAASHTGVENIRELIDKVNLAPAVCKYKVYVIDEAHMLSKGAFNALLKTLEEPPEHAIFVLATTEPHQFPATIISRCQRYDFRYLVAKDISAWLTNIAEKENVKINGEAIDFLASQSGGSGRDALSLLEQVANMGDDITKEKLGVWLGFVDWGKVFELTELIIKGETKPAIQLVNKMYYDGYDLTRLAQAWINIVRQMLATKLDNQDILGVTGEQTEKLSQVVSKLSVKQISWLLRELMDSVGTIKQAHVPQVPLEILIVRAVLELASEDEITKDSDDKPEGGEATKVEKPVIDQEVTKKEVPAAQVVSKFEVSEWPKICEQIAKSSPTLGAVMSKTAVDTEGGKITIKFSTVFYKDAMERPGNMRLLKEILSSYSESYTIECLVDESKEVKKDYLAVDEIVEVFGKA